MDNLNSLEKSIYGGYTTLLRWIALWERGWIALSGFRRTGPRDIALSRRSLYSDLRVAAMKFYNLAKIYYNHYLL
jgi:hypothetical protein